MKPDVIGAAFWVVILILILAAVTIFYSSGCCAATCETMLVECERGIEDLQQQVESMCSCALPEYDDGGCALAAAEVE